jgi:hypothetical protein
LSRKRKTKSDELYAPVGEKIKKPEKEIDKK